ncbi:uncharacterized protein TNCV_4318241 [Trichonephila clavipes]|nr:uncharacterized protein TNCV_4318241 [Trichonephila clavipes]
MCLGNVPRTTSECYNPLIHALSACRPPLTSSNILDKRGTFHINWKHEQRKLWADTNPHDVALVAFYDAKVTVWGAIAGPALHSRFIFFEKVIPKGFEICSVTGSHYTTLMQNYVIPELRQRNALNYIVWMQDAATLQKEVSVRRVVEQHFGGRVTSRYFTFPWPP